MNLFKKPTAEKIAANELEKARRDLLEHEKLSAYHSHMVEFLEDEIARLAIRSTIRAQQNVGTTISTDGFKPVRLDKTFPVREHVIGLDTEPLIDASKLGPNG